MTRTSTLDVLAFGTHPDDVELGAGGTIARMVADGYQVGIVDLTRGELGSRGTVELREQEARKASRILGVSHRVNVGISDGNIENTPENRLKVIRQLRQARPNIILIPAPDCRHPDHPAGARLIIDAVFQSGLSKISTEDADGTEQATWRPHHVLHYMQSVPFIPTVVVDVSAFWQVRNEAVQAYSSQVFNTAYEAGHEEPVTFVSNPEFMKWYDARARNYGYGIGAEFGEPFLYHQGPFGTDDLVATFKKERPFR